MKWTFLVLDFDGTYDNEEDSDLGVTPIVYMIPRDEILLAEQLAKKASEDFQKIDDDRCISELFTDYLSAKDIQWNEIGDIKLTFGERKVNYLSNYIHKVIV